MLTRRLPVAALLIALGSCAMPAPPPAPPPRVVAPPPSRPLPPPVAASSDWRDWPLTPGTWSYAGDARGSIARFGQPGGMPLLTLRCDRTARAVTLGMALPAPTSASAVTVRTTSVARALSLQVDGAGRSATVMAAGDPLLDAMGFSRGRFVVEQAGGAPLVIPAWAEILRVTEDCRR